MTDDSTSRTPPDTVGDAGARDLHSTERDCSCPAGECPGEKSAAGFVYDLRHLDTADQCDEIRKKLNELNGGTSECSRVHDDPGDCKSVMIQHLQAALGTR